MGDAEPTTYESYIEASPVPMWIQGVEEIHFANKAAADFLEFDTAADLVGESALAFVPHDDREFVRRRNRMILDREAEERVSTLEGETLARDGQLKHGRYVVYPIEYRDGNALVVTANDATARHEYEQRLKRQNERLRSLFENTTAAVVEYVIRDGRPVAEAVNGQFEETFGYDAETVVDEPVDEFIVPESRASEASSLNEKVENEEYLSAEVERRTADGLRSFLLRIAPIETDDETRGYAIYTDITERKEYEQRLEEQTEQLETLNRLLRHDINNDMNVVIGMTELVQAELDDEQARDRLGKVLTASRDVVELTRSARELMETMLSEDRQRKPVRLARVLESEVDAIKSAADGVLVQFDGPLPVVQVLADDLLASVFRNILKNAVQHNDKAVAEVDVAVETDAERVRVAIADNGPGIPDAQKESIFGKDEKGLDSDGTGIGLYLVHSLVDSYGGDVRVTDRADHPLGADDADGTVFTVELERAGTDD
jgi:PAS domain S-box-containing protein